MNFPLIVTGYAALLAALYATTTPHEPLAAEAAHHLLNHVVVALGWALSAYWLRNPVVAIGVSLMDEVFKYSFHRLMPSATVGCSASAVGIGVVAVVFGTRDAYGGLGLGGAAAILTMRSAWLGMEFMYKRFVYQPVLTLGLLVWRAWFQAQLAQLCGRGEVARPVSWGLLLVAMDVAVHSLWNTFVRLGPLDLEALQTYLLWTSALTVGVWAAVRWTRLRRAR